MTTWFYYWLAVAVIRITYEGIKHLISKKKAADDEKKLKDDSEGTTSPRKRKTKNIPQARLFLICTAGGLGGLIGIVALSSLHQTNQATTGTSTSNNPFVQTSSLQKPGSQTPQDTTDPAIEIKPHIKIIDDPSFPSLNTRDQYLRAVGDLARVQGRMLANKANSRNYPEIGIGPGKYSGTCNLGSDTLGAYRKECKIIQVNFSDGTAYYEKPIEVLTTIAHEYGHHLTEITIGLNSISGLEAELIADCFAGLMHGYWDKHGVLTEDEVRSALNMMVYVSKQEQLNTTDMHGDPGQRVGAFLAGAQKAQGQETPEYNNFCKSLDRVINWSAGLP
jgi:hypothetical protein